MRAQRENRVKASFGGKAPLRTWARVYAEARNPEATFGRLIRHPLAREDTCTQPSLMSFGRQRLDASVKYINAEVNFIDTYFHFI